MWEWLNHSVDALWVFVTVIMAIVVGRCIALEFDTRKLKRRTEAYNNFIRQNYSNQ